jgi:tRNA-2-methylthio-N6-dimethylallyladenosine synthase
MAGIEGLARIRYTTSHPRDMDDDLIAAHREVPALMPFLHLPVQSGSDRVLQAMNRGHTAADYLALVDRLRAARPDLALSSDFIAGHPGETEADHQATLDLIRRVGFALAFSFKYSARPGTPAAGAPHQLRETEKDRRLQEIQALLREQQDAFNRSCLGMRCDILFTGPGRHPGQVAGRSPWLQPVHAEGGLELVGQVRPCVVTAPTPIRCRSGWTAARSDHPRTTPNRRRPPLEHHHRRHRPPPRRGPRQPARGLARRPLPAQRDAPVRRQRAAAAALRGA